MKSSIIHHYHLSCNQCWNQTSFQPHFKNCSITRSLDRKRGTQFMVTQSRNHIDSTLASPRFQCMEPLTSLVPSIIILISIIHPRFINIDNPLRRNCSQLGYKSLPLCFIPFTVAVGFFLRVKPIFFKAREIVRELISPSQIEAIST